MQQCMDDVLCIRQGRYQILYCNFSLQKNSLHFIAEGELSYILNVESPRVTRMFCPTYLGSLYKLNFRLE